MERFLQYLFDGSQPAAIYALLALGLVVIYRGTGHLNFAQGEMALFCDLHRVPVRRVGHPDLASPLVIGLAVGFVLGAVAEVTLIRPIGKKSPFAVFVVTIGLFHAPQLARRGDLGRPAAAEHRRRQQAAELPDPVPERPRRLRQHLRRGVATKYARRAGRSCSSSPALLFLVFKKTRFGLAMRAVASNTESAKLVGIRTEHGADGQLGPRRGDRCARRRGRSPASTTTSTSVLMFTRLHLRLGGGDARRLRQPGRRGRRRPRRSASSRTWPPATRRSGSARS